MALLSFEYNKTEFAAWHSLIKLFPEMANQVLGFVGNEGKKILKQRILSGQLLTYHSGSGGDQWTTTSGQRKVSYRIRYAKYVKIASFPANFFSSKARRLRSGATGARLKIYETLKSYVDSDIQNMLGAYEQKYLGKLLEKFDANPKSWKRY